MAAFEAWLVFLILVVNVVGELQRKTTLAASRGFLAAARLSCLDMHHLTCGISSLLHSVNLILFTLLLVHVLRISRFTVTSSQSPNSLSSPITSSVFHSRLKTPLSQILSPIVFLFLQVSLHGSLTCTELSGHWRLFLIS